MNALYLIYLYTYSKWWRTAADSNTWEAKTRQLFVNRLSRWLKINFSVNVTAPENCQIQPVVLKNTLQILNLIPCETEIQHILFLFKKRKITHYLSDGYFRGIGVLMVEPLYQSPSFDGVLPGLAFLQVFLPFIKVSVMIESCMNRNRETDAFLIPVLCRTFPLWWWDTSSGLVPESGSWICAPHLEGRPATSLHWWRIRYKLYRVHEQSAAPGITVCGLSTLSVGTSPTFFCVEIPDMFSTVRTL